MTHQIAVLTAQKCSYLSSHCRAAKGSVFGGWCSWFLGRQLANKWLCTTQNCLFCVVLVVQLRQSSFSEKTADHLLGSASCESNLCLIWLILKHPYSRLLFTFGIIRVNLKFVTCYNVIDVFRSSAIVFWSISFNQSTRAFFWAIDELCGIQCNIECMTVPLMSKVVSISR